MLHNRDDVQVGDRVYLVPKTKQAPPICYTRRAPVSVVSLDRWPYVQVQVGALIYNIHRDNISKHKPKHHVAKGEGDSNTGTEAAASLPADPGREHDGWQEPTLL